MGVLRASFCRLESEFRQAVGRFEAEGADVLVTLHMAYSPSLESIDVLSETPLPIVDVYKRQQQHRLGQHVEIVRSRPVEGIHPKILQRIVAVKHAVRCV